MESSSEDSFAWTDTSSDKSESPTNSPKTMAKNEESDYDKSFKRKLQKELFQNVDHNEHEEEEPRAKKKKKVKREPVSPPPVKHETNGHDAAAAERLLKLKVKQEKGSSTHKRPRSASRSRSASPSHEPPRKKHKRDRAQRSPEPDTVDAEEPPKKKKKKSKRTSENADVLIDKFEAEETVVEERRPAPKPVVKPYTSQEFVDDSNSEDERPAPAPASPPKQIRERITFEEESTEPPESDSEAKAASRTGRLTRYLRARPRLRAVGGAPSASITAADDVWLVHVPRGLSAQALAGVALSPDSRCKLKADGRHYEALPEPGPTCAALLLRDEAWRLRGVTLRGALRLRERVPRTRAPTNTADDETSTVPLPVTRIRHPLLGADYELALLPPAPRRSPEPVPVTPKKKKKKKDKSRRSPPPGAGVWDSERGIEESLFNY